MATNGNNGSSGWWPGFHALHRWLGLAAAILVLFVAVTGIALNHVPALGLDRSYVETDWILDRYGVAAPGDSESLMAGDRRVTRLGDRLYLDDREVLRDRGALTGAGRLEGMIALATARRVHLFTADGRPVETVAVPEDVQPLARMDVADARIRVQGEAGRTMSSDATMLEWRRADTGPGKPGFEPIPQPLRADLERHYRHHTLDWERMLLDAHSGRILGNGGVLLADALAVVLVLLGVTGIVAWWQRRQQQKEQERMRERIRQRRNNGG